MTTTSTQSYFCIKPSQLEGIPREWRESLCLRVMNGSCKYPKKIGIFDNVCLNPENYRVCNALYQPKSE